LYSANRQRLLAGDREAGFPSFLVDLPWRWRLWSRVRARERRRVLAVVSARRRETGAEAAGVQDTGGIDRTL